MNRRKKLTTAATVLALGAAATVLSTSGAMATNNNSSPVTVTNTASSPVPVNVGNLPSTQQVGGTVNVGNLPATQQIGGTVNVGNLPDDQQVHGNVKVDNLPSDQQVHGAVDVRDGTSFSTFGSGSSDSSGLAVGFGATPTTDVVIEMVTVTAVVPTGSRPLVSAGCAHEQVNVPVTYQVTSNGQDYFTGTLTGATLPCAGGAGAVFAQMGIFPAPSTAHAGDISFRAYGHNRS